MRNHRTWPGLLCVIPILVLATTQPSLAAPPQWLAIRSPHFTVMTDAGEERGREVATHFERMRSVFGAYMYKPNLDLSAPLQIVAFRNTKEMRRFVPLWRGKPVDMMGYYHQSRDCGIILLDLSVRNYSQTAFHEYAHQLLNVNTSAYTQPWFDEGFSEYFSTLASNGNGAVVGAVHKKNWKTVRSQPLMRTAELLQVRQDSAIYNQNGDARNLFYGQSWLMVHYLFDTHSLPRASDYFARIAHATTSVEDAFQQAFGMSVEQFDRALSQYARQNSPQRSSVQVSLVPAQVAYRVRRLTPTEADAELADVHLHSPDYDDQAVREFDNVLKRDPNNAVALRGLGYAFLQDRNFARAAEFLDRARHSNPQDARVHYYRALLIKEEAGAEAHPAPEKIAEMQQELAKVIAAEPGYAAAYQLLALTYEWQGNNEKSVEAMKRATEINPRNRSYRAELARLSGGMERAATTILNQLEPSRAHISAQTAESKSNPQPAPRGK